MRIQLHNPTGRNTQAHVLEFGPYSLYFSYQTLIAFSGPRCGSIRIANHWGPTTGRHFRELGCAGFQEVSDERFDVEVAAALVRGEELAA